LARKTISALEGNCWLSATLKIRTRRMSVPRRRLVMPAQGVEYIIVNGTVLCEHGKHTGALPGQVLRSGAA